jgi:hypothetical protein
VARHTWRHGLATMALTIGTGCSPQLLVTPEALEIGEPALGATTSAQLTLSHLQGSPLDDLRLTSTEPFVASIADGSLAQGESTTVEVSITPFEQGLYEGELKIRSRTKGFDSVRVHLSAYVLAPVARLVDDTPVCGESGQDGVVRVELTNDGEGPLLVNDPQLVSDGDGGFWPLQDYDELFLEPGGVDWLDLGCDPHGASSGQLLLTTNDPDQPELTIDLFPQRLSLSISSPMDGAVWSTEDDHQVVAEANHVDHPDSIRITWASDIDGIFGFTTSTSGQEIAFDAPGLSVGSHTVTATAASSDGAVVAQQLALHVGTPPTVAITQPTAGVTAQEGESWIFEGTVSDDEQQADTLTLRWTSTIDGVLPIDHQDSAGLVTTEPLTPGRGTHVVALEAEDEWGLTGRKSRVFTVNGQPTPRITSPRGGELVHNTLTLEATLSDHESGPGELLCSWASDVDGHLGDAQGDESCGCCTLDVTDGSVGAHTFSVEVTDPDGGRGSTSVNAVLDGAPTVSFGWPRTEGWRPSGVDVEMGGSATDTLDDPMDLAVTVVSDLDGSLGVVTPDTSGTWSLTAVGMSPGWHLLTATAVDTLGDHDSAEISFEILDCDDDGDVDGDGFSPSSGDCDDSDATVYPGAVVNLDSPRGDCRGYDLITVDGADDVSSLGGKLGAGDIDGDGLPDLLFGVSSDDSGSYVNGGAVYLLPGSALTSQAERDSTSMVRIEGTSSWAYMGSQVDVLSDLDGDGYNELFTHSQENNGTVYLFHGRSTWTSSDTSSADLIIEAATGVVQLGLSTAVGDFDGDGLDDLAMGAAETDIVVTDDGTAFLFWGSSLTGTSLTTDDADVAWVGDDDDVRLGDSIVNAGDVDGDGVDDLLIASPGSDVAATQAGSVALYTGLASVVGTGTAPAPVATILGESSYDLLGGDDSLGGAGDVDADGYAEFLLTAIQWDSPHESNVGEIYLWYGGPALTGTLESPDADASWWGNNHDAVDQPSLLSAGDIDGDGLGDFLLGADNDDSYSQWAGRVGLWLGSSASTWSTAGSLDDADRLFDGAAYRAHAGCSIVGDADLDGDGTLDFAIGATGYNDGRVYVHLNHGLTCTSE